MVSRAASVAAGVASPLVLSSPYWSGNALLANSYIGRAFDLKQAPAASSAAQNCSAPKAKQPQSRL
jgi:hypothetical protein